MRSFREAMAFAGRIADIDLMDPNFYRSIVLMIEHNEEGASGLVVNRPSQYSLGEVIEGVDDTPAASIPVCVEGPVQQNALFVLHEGFGDAAAAEPATSPLIDYLKGHWGELPAEDRPSVRIYAGYSGCGSGQLEGELKVDSQVVLKTSKPVVFHPEPESAWAEALAKKGPLYQIILQTGSKPSRN